MLIVLELNEHNARLIDCILNQNSNEFTGNGLLV